MIPPSLCVEVKMVGLIQLEVAETGAIGPRLLGRLAAVSIIVQARIDLSPFPSISIPIQHATLEDFQSTRIQIV